MIANNSAKKCGILKLLFPLFLLPLHAQDLKQLDAVMTEVFPKLADKFHPEAQETTITQLLSQNKGFCIIVNTGDPKAVPSLPRIAAALQPAKN